MHHHSKIKTIIQKLMKHNLKCLYASIMTVETENRLKMGRGDELRACFLFSGP